MARSTDLTAAEARAALLAELTAWRDADDDAPVGLWSAVARGAKLPMAHLREVAEVAQIAKYAAAHRQARPTRALAMRRDLGEILIAQVRGASDAQVVSYNRARSRFIES